MANYLQLAGGRQVAIYYGAHIASKPIATESEQYYQKYYFYISTNNM